jgi:hypothetical protein
MKNNALSHPRLQARSLARSLAHTHSCTLPAMPDAYIFWQIWRKIIPLKKQFGE